MRTERTHILLLERHINANTIITRKQIALNSLFNFISLFYKQIWAKLQKKNCSFWLEILA